MKKIKIVDKSFAHCKYSNNPLPPTSFSKYIEWDRKVSDIVNPFSSVFGKMTRYLESDNPETFVIPLIELALGAQVDPLVGLYNYFKDFEFDDEEYYEMLGIGKSYRHIKKSGPRKREESSDPNF